MPDTSAPPRSTATYSNGKSVIVRCATCSTLNRVDLSRLANRPKCSRCANTLPFDKPLVATDADFQKFLDGALVPVVVDFYADWCGPCKAMAPVLDNFARQQIGHVLVLKMDTDANPITASRFNITSIPTIIVFKNGTEWKRQLGAVPRAALDTLVS